MADRSTAPGRIALMGLVVAGAMAGMAGTASAQYYYYDDGYEPYPAYGYGYGVSGGTSIFKESISNRVFMAYENVNGVSEPGAFALLGLGLAALAAARRRKQ